MNIKSEPHRYLYMNDDEIKKDPNFRDDTVKMFKQIGVANFVFGLLRRAKVEHPELGSRMMDYHFMAMTLEQQRLGETHTEYLETLNDSLVFLKKLHGIGEQKQ